MSEGYDIVIGLEVHAQLSTKTKLFCSCAQAFGAPANSQTCETCLGMPGTLPALNAEAVALAVRAALALGSEIQARSIFARKNYFYPDLPKGYQISQHTHPYAWGGKLSVRDGDISRDIRLTRIHIEEDAGKNIHDDVLAGRRSYVDFNRGGTPLIEIVSEPELTSSQEAAAYLKTLRQLLRAIEVCDGNMEEGSLRCDANVSLKPKGTTTLGTRVELKNINSFRFVMQAIDYEVMRQAERLDAGERIVQETRLWDTQAKQTRAMRGKEDAQDYRYFPEPDLPPLDLTPAYIEQIKKNLPELPAAKHARYVDELGLSAYDATILVDDAQVARLFEDALAVGKVAKACANWVINEVLRELRGRTVAQLPFGGRELGELVALVEDETLSGKMAKELFAEMMEKGASPRAIVEERGLSQVRDSGAIESLVDAVISEQAESVAKVQAGKTNVLGFLVGQVMQKSQGRANPKTVAELMRKKLLG